MSLDRDHLFASLPGVFRKAPRPIDALVVTYAGAAGLLARVDDGRFVVSDGTTDALVVDVDDAVTLAALATTLGLLDDVVATVVDPAAGAVLAATLLDDADRALTPEGVTFVRWQSTTWRLMDPVRRLLRQAVPRLDAAAAQLNLLTSAGFFADYWGTFTDTIRQLSEPDADYTLRQLRELTRPRENNRALATVIETDTGIPVVEVADLRREVFVLGGPMRERPLAGRRYNACTAEVRLEGFPSALALAVAERHIAAGITLFVKGATTLDALPSTFSATTTPLQVGAVPAMQIGVGSIGNAKIAL